VKIVVIGGTGLIGSKVVAKLSEHGVEAVPASPRLGINTITGEGLAVALEGAAVVVDVSNSPNFEYAASLEFFERSTHNLLEAERVAKVDHHVALSVVGTNVLWQNGDPTTTTAGYFRAKQTQEDLIAASGISYSIVHATQFFEFLKSIADQATNGTVVSVPDVEFQPVAAEVVAAVVGRIAVGGPRDGVVEVAGPDRFRFAEPIKRVLAAMDDPRRVVTDHKSGYYGISVDDFTLVPDGDARRGEISLDQWIAETITTTKSAAA
jgi:uncharacterized protein YbjT (DUF2867 family)